VRFVVHQARDVVLLREPVDEFRFVLADTALQEVGDAGVEDPGGAGEYVNVVDGHWDSPFEVERLPSVCVGQGWLPRSLSAQPDAPKCGAGEKVGLLRSG